MATKTVVYYVCDKCGNKGVEDQRNVATISGVVGYTTDAAGSTETIHGAMDLCLDCIAKFINKYVLTTLKPDEVENENVCRN